MKRISQHKIFLAGDSHDHARAQVHRFFDSTSLVIYDLVQVSTAKSLNGLDDRFFNQLSAAENRNRLMVQDFVDELLQTGIEKITDLGDIAQGYASKTLHILSHFLDGFIGIDSYFFNLIDDSHWLPGQTSQLIKQNPQHYWLIHVDCFATTPEDAGLLHK